MQTVDNTKENKNILIIEDDKDIASLIKLHLSDTYTHVESIHDGLKGFNAAQTNTWDIILLDIRLPSMNGLDICKELRANNIRTPILMLTSKSSDMDQVLGLELGADDYITKPFSLMNLSARVKATLRRQNLSNSNSKEATEKEIYQHGQIELNIKKRKASIQSQLIKLTAKEFDLLLHFVKSPGTVFSRNDLLSQVWKYNTHQGYEHTVNSHINRLRNKLSEHLDGKECIVTVWGVGYKLNEGLQ